MQILIAEDQEMGRLILARYLRDWGHEVIETSNGEEACAEIVNKLGTIDMLITDWSMPGMSGVELARQVRQLSASGRYIYIILLTGKSEVSDRFQAFSEGGVDDYIVKPFESSELHLRIQVGMRALSAERCQREYSYELQEIIQQQTSLMQETQDEIVHRLFTAMEVRESSDENLTQDQTRRVGLINNCLSQLFDWSKNKSQMLQEADPLHEMDSFDMFNEILEDPTAEEQTKPLRILVVDDQDMARLIIVSYLREWGHEVIEASNGAEACEEIANGDIDILITDWNMPVMNGIELAQAVRQVSEEGNYIYILLLTGKGELDDKLEAFSEGGIDDYIVKPFENSELQLRIQVGMRVVAAERRQRQLNEKLQDIVSHQTALIQETQDEIIYRLFSALEFRDGETGDHVQRIGLMSACLADLMGWSEERIKLIKAAAPLHDIGKIAIPDEILRKPGKLTKAEFEIMKQHPEIGFNMLLGSRNGTLIMGAIIAQNHHECWDGSGYPLGISGKDIPIEARIVAIVDNYDALLSNRVYRNGRPEEDVIKLLQAGSGTKFDAEILDIFLKNLDTVKEYLEENMRYADEDNEEDNPEESYSEYSISI